MPQFDMDDTISEANLIVEEVCCNMIEIENHDEDSQEDNKNSLRVHGQEYSIDAHSNEEFTTLEKGIKSKINFHTSIHYWKVFECLYDNICF